MLQPNPVCPTCAVHLEEGYILDNMYGEGMRKAAEWVEGQPVMAFFGGVKTKHKNVWPVRSFRCPKCGLLREYAL
jgi:hypothetical protein